MGAMLPRRVLMAAIATVLAVLAFASVASADTYSVNDPTDAPLATSTSTSCVSSNGGSCTLRAAVQAADNVGGASTINLPANTYKLTIAPGDYNAIPACTTTYEYEGNGCDGNDPAYGDLDVLTGTTLTITGAGSSSTIIDANTIDRAFAVQSGGDLSLSKLAIQNGQPAYGPFCYSTYYAQSYDCAPSSAGSFQPLGGAIYSDGALQTTGDVILRGNQAFRSSQGSGGAIYADSDSSALSLSGTTFSANVASNGSALFDAAPVTATISGSTFSANDASGGNGAIDGQFFGANPPSLSITGSTFSDNVAGNGGAIYWSSPGDLTADGANTFTGNSAAAGGVLYNNFYNHATSLSGDVIKDNSAYDAGVIFENDSSGSTGDSVTLNNDEVEGNSATYVGVGYFSQGAGPTSTNSSYIGNSGADGGVFYLSDTSDFGQGTSLTNVTMSENSSNYGAAIYVSNTATNPLDLVNDTIAFNHASVSGGGIFGAGDATPGPGGGVTNTIVAENSGGDCGSGPSSSFASSEDLGYNADSDGSCFGYAGAPSTDKVGVNPLLSPAAENGGPNPVLTNAEHSGSPTVDAGSNAACPGTDARGLHRPQTAADPCDIGAFELLSAAPSLTNAAPASASVSQPFNETLTVSDGAAGGPSTGTTVVDQLPGGETLYGATPSQGSCSSSGSPAKLTCDLGLLAPGAAATVQLVVAEANAGAVTNTATVTDDEGSSVSSAATTQVAAPPVLTSTPPAVTIAAPVATTGAVSAVAKTTATLSGVVTPGGQPTGFFFQYGLSSSYGDTTTVAHTGSDPQAVLAALSGLSPVTTYHYRLVAINDSGTSYGADASFKTPGNPPPGKVLLGSRRLVVKGGKVRIPLTCASTKRCLGVVSITTRLKMNPARPAVSVACTASKSSKYRIGAHRRNLVTAPVRATCMKALAGNGGKLEVKIALTPRSGQQGLVELVTLVRK
jgi:hypothetical protein